MQDLTPTRVYLVRHGAVVGAERRRFIGHLDVPLSAAGEAQIEALARQLGGRRLDAVYASDLSRTRRSAEILAAPHGLHVEPVRDLREFAMGRWEGLTAEEIRTLDAAAFQAWIADVGRFQFPEGESLEQVTARAWGAFERIVGAHAGARIAVVAHGGTNRAILCRALGMPLARILALGQDYAALSVVEAVDGGWRLRLLNHCEPVLAPSP